MSSITDATLIGYVSPADITFLTTAAPGDAERGQSFGVVREHETDKAGGTKFFTSDLLLAAFNYFLPSEIIDWLSAHTFDDVTEAVLVLEYEGSDRPSVHRITNGTIKEMS